MFNYSPLGHFGEASDESISRSCWLAESLHQCQVAGFTQVFKPPVLRIFPYLGRAHFTIHSDSRTWRAGGRSSGLFACFKRPHFLFYPWLLHVRSKAISQ